MIKAAFAIFFLFIAGLMWFGGEPNQMQWAAQLGITQFLQTLYEWNPWTVIICVVLAIASIMTMYEY